ncbi:GNAT family N-acetyltransferase [Streptomyces sp. LP05-1]|uniref:GNAT family N-acetyltransferase n=1 Tax=Streptomyces pyxinae TaxID=2970734 RepID=A0ABT2CBR4_9ACTN|nr:GNAT family N-acetyltransferase [Streptomyces sp. LP05-1]MCS0634829.1 GNAT family N-acetyltransferase [Streptomyces sp. LP05-1]
MTDASVPPVPPVPFVLRPARPSDAPAIAALDSSFTTGTIYQVVAGEHGFTLRETPVDPPLRKVFPADGPDDEPEDDEPDDGPGRRPGDHAPDGGAGAGPGRTRTVVAEADGALCGFVTASFEPWNARLTVEDIEVAPGHRGRGVGRALMEQAAAFGRECGAGQLWLEVSNVNVPAVRAYLRMGFTLCGLDVSLYENTASAGEQALFMRRGLR